MCGIVGVTWSKKSRQYVLDGLKTLEYRGYDSAGIYYQTNKESRLFKTVKKVEGLCQLTPKFKCGAAMGHTRWATHGEVNEINAHPQVSSDSNIYVVHNGVISNYKEIKSELISKGAKFVSNTDTECLANLFMDLRKEHIGFLHALHSVGMRIKGQAAALFMDERYPGLIGFIKKGSPLLVARDNNTYYFASDLDPFYNYCGEFAELPDNVYGIAKDGELKTYKGNELIELTFKPIPKDRKIDKLGDYSYHMLKEIHDEPEVLKTLAGSMENLKLDNKLTEYLKTRNITFLASGTSYHACLIGSKYFEAANRTIKVRVASEFLHEKIESNNLYIMVSQSGETYDLIRVMDLIKKEDNNLILALVNTPVSTIGRKADYAIDIKAGKEVAVASTKAYISEVVALYIISKKIKEEEYRKEVEYLCKELKKLRGHQEEIATLASKYSFCKDSYFIGRLNDKYLAEEMSLKLKEVSYIHSEAVFGGELKHGPIALIDKDFLSIFVITDKRLKESTESSIAEVKARSGQIVILSTVGSLGKYDGCSLTEVSELSPLLLVTWIQYFAYYMALVLNRNIDKPRNLAKSVTVE